MLGAEGPREYQIPPAIANTAVNPRATNIVEEDFFSSAVGSAVSRVCETGEEVVAVGVGTIPARLCGIGVATGGLGGSVATGGGLKGAADGTDCAATVAGAAGWADGGGACAAAGGTRGMKG